MIGRSVLSIGAAVALGLALVPGGAAAKEKSLKDQIVGTWTLVSWEQTRPDGSKFQRFGAHPKGVNMYDANGHFALVLMHPELPKISSGDPVKVSADEAQAIVKGSIAYFGTYTVNDKDKTISLKLDGTTLVNQLGMDQKRTITSIGPDEMKYSNATAVAGGKIDLVWKRAR